MSKKPRSLVAKFSVLACLFAGVAASAGCNSTLGLEEYEVTSLTRCDDDLVDFAADEQNCGECGIVCPSGSDCMRGSCECPDEGTFCNDALSNAVECADLRTDEEHCGKCGEACAKGASCEAGKCGCDVAGQTVCSDECVDLDSDEQNCGKCGNQCAKGASCNDGECECDVRGEVACDGACTDPDSDVDHCGACGHACEIANASQMCASAECLASACSANFLDCDHDLYTGERGTGCEVDSRTDDENCGSCGFACDEDRVCDGGECVCDVPDAGGVCDPRSNCGCGELGMNCSLQGGSWACIPPGYGTESYTCTLDEECAVGYGCVGGVCRVRCNEEQIENDSCGVNGACIQVVDSDGEDIDGYQVCAEPCNPSSYDSAPYGTVGCPSNQQCVVADGTSLCAQQGTVYGSLGSSCSSYQDCSAGYGCVGGLCQPYCYMGYSTCSSYFGYQYSCMPFSTPADVQGSEVGFCSGGEMAACGDPCDGTTICESGATCIDTIEEGPICMPQGCQACFDSGQGCNWNGASCSVNYCGSN